MPIVLSLEQGEDIVAKKTGQKRSKGTGGKQRAETPKSQAAPEAPSTLPGIPPPGSALPATILPPPLAAEVALQKRQATQKWTGLPKKGKVRKTVSAIIALKVQGYSTNEIAEQLQLKPASVRQYLWIAGRNGWLNTQDPHEKAHSELVHRAVSNLEEWMHARDARTGLPDKEITLAAASGLGIFGGGPAQQQESQATNILAIQITMPQGGNLPQMRDGNAGGTPAYVEGEVLNVPVQPRRQLAE
jgi:hypothetical protein